MTNTGKWIDRFPNIRVAGRRYPIPELNAGQCFQFPISPADAADALIRSGERINDLDSRYYSRPPPNDVIYKHYNTNVKDILESDFKKGFEAFRAELRETAYKSYWRDEVGKIPDQVPNLPIGLDPENAVFGLRAIDRTTAAELINPKKCSSLVNYENNVGHDLYCKSHNSYYPGEQRKTNGVHFDPDRVHGKRTVTETSGKRVKTLMKWIDQSVVTTTSKPLAEYKHCLYYPLGKARVCTQLPAFITKATTFGKPSQHGNIPTMKNVHKVIPLLVTYLYTIKRKGKKCEMNFRLLKTRFNSTDDQKNKRLPAELIYKMVKDQGLIVDSSMMNMILDKLGLFDQHGTVPYVDFINLIDSREPLPDFGKIDDTNDTNYCTTYRELCSDFGKKIQYENIPKAGSASFRGDLPSIGLPFGSGWCSANLEDIPMQTTVDDVIRPHIFMHYGLSIYDVFKPRSKEFLKELFIKKVGLQIPDNIFDIMWEEGLKRDGVVSVETFKNILGEVSTWKLQQTGDDK